MNVRARLASSVALGMLCIPGLASAQNGIEGAPAAAPASPQEDVATDIVVTGSRVRSPAATSTSPLIEVNAQAIALQGTPSAEALLNVLPQVSGSNTSGQSTFGTPGIATVNLRKLGVTRTLVLIDGRRLMPGDPTLPVADLNFIPTALVSSVEVLTGGASTAYGSDAVAGVVNFKLKRDLNGILADYQVTAYQHDNDDAAARSRLRAFGVTAPTGTAWDGWTHDVTLAAGHDFGDGRGNLTAYATYRSAQPIGAIDRDFSACGVGTTTVTQPFDTHVCTGSGTSGFGRFRTGGTGGGLAANPDGSATFVPYTGALAYNSARENYLQRQDERYTAGAMAHYAFSEAADLYADVMFMRDETRAQIAPAGIVGNRTYRINCDNPLLAQSQAVALCGANAGSANAFWSGTIAKRVEVAGRQRYYDIRHTDYRGVLGLKGDLGGGWSYDVFGQYGRVDYLNDATNDVSVARVQDALLVRNVGGTNQCISGAAGCAPLNIFQLGQISPAAADYVFASGRTVGRIDQKVASASLNGDLGRMGIRSPFASNGVAVALGLEYREDEVRLTPTANILNGDLAGFGGTAPANGRTDVKEGFVEAIVPLVSDVRFVHALTLNAGYRRSDYNLAGGADTYKASLTWAPSPDVSLRGGYNRAIRAPNVVEIFLPQSLSSASITDVCAGTSPRGTLVQCQNTGVTAAQYGRIAECASNFCTTLAGGNRALKPETADTYTAGVVLTPRALKGLVVSVDYYDIKVRDLIGTVSPTLAYSQCLNNAVAFYCGLIKRDTNGSLATTGGYIVNTNVNTGFLHTAGIDATVSYRLALGGAGALLLDANGTWTDFRRTSPLPGQSAYDCAGLYGPTCGSPTPSWRHNAQIGWQTPGRSTFVLGWRFVGASRVDINAGDSVLSGATGGVRDIADARIKPYSYFDLSGVIPVADGDFSVRFGVRNIADRSPPIVDNFNLGVNADYGNGNTFPALYDTLGRTVFMGLTVKL